MASLRRIPVTWSGLTGLPGLSVFYADMATDAGANLATFFSSVSNRFPNGLSWSTPASGDVISDATGAITGAYTGATVISQTGSGGATAYAAGVGVAITWQTAGIINGRRLKGRTFMCPILASEFQTDGTITAAALTTLGTAAGVLVTADVLKIWHRPTPGGTDGISSAVVGYSIADRVTALRSRRY